MKYRFLTDNELDLLENDFEIFLNKEGVGFKEWKKFNKDAPESAQKLLAKFSDIIFFKVLQDVEYLEYRTDKSLRLFECRKNKMIVIGIDLDKNSFLNLTDPSSIVKIFDTNFKGLKSFQIERLYEFNREDEIYHLMENGCYVVEGECFNLLSIQRKSIQN